MLFYCFNFRIRGDRSKDMNPNEGRVEIFQSNKWGLVCDYYWDLPDAMAVCKQLGFLK